MRDLTRLDEVPLPVAFREPTLTPQVAAAVAHYLAPDPHAGPRVRVLPAHLRQRAREFVATADDESTPADVATVRKWLLIVAGGVPNVPDSADFGARASAVAQACHDLPGWGFSADTARAALARFKWFPSAAEVRELIEEATAGHRNTIRALRALAEAQEPVQEAEAPRPAGKVREAMAATLRGLVRETEARARAAEAGPLLRKVEPNHPKPEVLAQLRAAAGIAAKGAA